MDFARPIRRRSAARCGIGPMLVKIFVLLVVIVLGVLACIRVWRLRHRRQPLDPGSLPGMTPEPPDIGGAP